MYKENPGKLMDLHVAHETFDLLFPGVQECSLMLSGFSPLEMHKCFMLLPRFDIFLGVASYFIQKLSRNFEGSLLAINPCIAHGLEYKGSF